MNNHSDVLVVGSGMGAISVAALCSKHGLKVTIIEQNHVPGGCTSSYKRKGFVFEAGATTLVGLDKNQPLRYLLDQLGVELPVRKLDLPMQVILKNGKTIHKKTSLDEWIAEAERVFGVKNQKLFWKLCYRISQFVWGVSTVFLRFPMSKTSDLWNCVSKFRPYQLLYLPFAFISMQQLLRWFGLHKNQDFVDFVNEQLMITAQNKMEEVNVLFGATSLCYTNYGNYYIDGGLVQMVQPLLDYIKSKNGKVLLKEEVVKIQKTEKCYIVQTDKNTYTSTFIVSGIPLNNTVQLFADGLKKKIFQKVFAKEKVNSAFQMGIVFRKTREFEALHHQIHLKEPLIYTGSHSIFISLNHPNDTSRSQDSGVYVASVSTHFPCSNTNEPYDKEKIAQKIIEILEENSFLKADEVLYFHVATPHTWENWTKRAWGLVGGYPQYLKIKPWQMPDARLDGYKAYQVGDTVYPGQGIPGVTLSGIIAFEKLKSDWL